MSHSPKRYFILIFFITASIFCTPAYSTQQWEPFDSTNEALIILKSDQRSDLLAAADALEALGAHATHIIPPSSIIAFVPLEVEAQVRALENVSELHRGMVTALDSVKEDTGNAVGAWNYLKNPVVRIMDVPDVHIPNDMRYLDDHGISISSIGVSAAPGTNQTSEFMIGKIAVGIILPESTGNTENWSDTRRNQVFSEIVTAMNWWVTQGGAKANLTFIYEQRFNVPTQYEPITMSGMSDEATWVADVLGNMGYTSGAASTRARSYDNYLRTTYGTDWAFCFIVVDSLNDSDGKFNDGYFAWAYLGGPYSILTYDNNGYGINGMDTVARHETGHIFLAGDEYCTPGYACCDFNYYGYLNIYNGNCESNNPASIECVMKRNSNAICDYTRGQIGWKDSDYNAKYDPIDNTVTLEIKNTPTPDANRRVTFTGTATDVPCNSPTRTEVNINKITTVRYRIDGGSWQAANTDDGAYDEDVENFTFTTPPLSLVYHTIEIEAVSSSGNVSITDIHELPPPSMIKVDTDAQGSVHDGKTWQTAYTTITEALAQAKAGDEVWVAEGLYNERITMTSGVGIYGGFTGTEADRNLRNAKLHTTVIDYGAGGPVVTIPQNTDSLAIIDGFTIRNGQSSNGGGIYCNSQSSAVISNNIITSNNATNGGGIYCNISSVTISNNTITGNNTTSNGAGIYCVNGGRPVIVGNIISGNNSNNTSSNSGGGGIYLSSSSPDIIRNSIVNNLAKRNGGGIYCYYSSPLIQSNVIAVNSAAYGGGVYLQQFKNTMTNNTLVSNTLTGATTYGGAVCSISSTATIANNIVAYNSSGIYNATGTLTLSGNNVHGNTANNYLGVSPGYGDISQPPMFKNQSSGNYRLAADSPCIDSGSNGDAANLDCDGLIRPQDGNGDMFATVDIGAYEYPADLNIIKRYYANGESAVFGGAAVSAVFADQQQVYVEKLDRSGGIRVNTMESLETGAVVNIVGILGTDTSGERYIDAMSGYPRATGKVAAIHPYGMNIASLTGGNPQYAGADNSGLLVKLWGRVCGIGPGNHIVIGDLQGIKAVLKMPQDAPALQLDNFLMVTGISTGTGVSGSAVVRVSKGDDVVVLL